LRENITLNIDIKGVGIQTVPCGVTLLELSRSFQPASGRPIFLAKMDQNLEDLRTPLTYDCAVEFLDISDPNGFRTYQRGLSFLMIYAAKMTLGQKTRVIIAHSVNKNYYCEIPEVTITDEILSHIEEKMRETVLAGVPIEKLTLPVEEAVKIAAELDLEDKIANLHYRRSSNVNFYKLDWFYDYFYGQMPPSAGLLKSFKLTRRSKGFMLHFPSAADDFALAEMSPSHKISEVFAESSEWARILKADTVGALNGMICDGGVGDIMRVNEALHEKKIASLADRIHERNRSIVLIAGPSSSGKTTFAKRLCVQLRVNGLRPHMISLDDYFLDRTNAPRDSDGNFDFEALEALDIQRMNEDFSALLDGRPVEMPTFNFVAGRSEYRGNVLRMAPGDVLIIEGIHGLNEQVTAQIPREKKFKIFISALTQVNIDDHNRIPTADTRLIRRIVRDHRHRGADAKITIGMWPSVLRGENKNIFPFQEEADAFFNSALVYEMCVLKQFAEPLLFHISQRDSAYTEARRLIKFLDSFLAVSSEQVASNSILREFIGGSCFEP
jgi:uridine kinase